jgi:flagellar motor switch protein FliN/FliY
MSSSPISSSSTDEVRGGDLEGLTALLDIRCEVDFVLGNGSLTLRECLALQKQHVVKLKQSAGSDLSITVHGVNVAAGEVVIVDNTAALRVSRVMPPPGVEGA